MRVPSFLPVWAISLIPSTTAGLIGTRTPASTDSVSFALPESIPRNASQQLVPAPVGVSIEFFTFPDYMNQVPSTTQCLENLKDLSGVWPPMRIGGTTQDRATYNATQPEAVKYSVSNPKDAPSSLTFGPSLMSLAANYGGKTILGLNRQRNNLNNTVAAASEALATMSNLEAIELGNEPNFYSSSSPVAGGSWSASKDFTSQVSWQSKIASAVDRSGIFSAGVYFGAGSFNIQGLAAQEGNAISTVRDFCSHNYPQSASTANLAKLMSHSAIKSQIAQFKSEFVAANAKGKPYIFGETNSATQGGGGISPTFGAGLWIVDYVMQSLLMGVQSLYFHQGTIGNCQYCWWGKYSIGAPYYGAYFATQALSGASQIAPLDDGTTNYAGYAIYSGDEAIKILLYNSDFYDGTGSRSSKTFVVAGLCGSSVTATRLTAAAATARQDQGQSPTISGQTFDNGSCKIQGRSYTEITSVFNGTVQFTLKASEALIVYL